MIKTRDVAATVLLVVAVTACADRSTKPQPTMPSPLSGAGSGVTGGGAALGAGKRSEAGLLEGYLHGQHQKSKQQAAQQSESGAQPPADKPNPPWQ